MGGFVPEVCGDQLGESGYLFGPGPVHVLLANNLKHHSNRTPAPPSEYTPHTPTPGGLILSNPSCPLCDVTPFTCILNCSIHHYSIVFPIDTLISPSQSFLTSRESFIERHSFPSPRQFPCATFEHIRVTERVVYLTSRRVQHWNDQYRRANTISTPCEDIIVIVQAELAKRSSSPSLHPHLFSRDRVSREGHLSLQVGKSLL